MLAKDVISIPDLLSARSVLVVQPHPDDADIGAGATLAKLARAGATITLVTMTDGRRGTMDATQPMDELVDIRRHEQEQAARATGVKNLIWFDFQDGELPYSQGPRDRLITVIRQYRPDLVMTVDPWLPYEAHPDHRHTGLAAAAACLFSSMPTFNPEDLGAGLQPHAPAMVAFFGTANPNRFIDVDDTWQAKVEAISAHKSQFSGQILQLFLLYLDLKARELAAGRGFERAEAFKLLTPTHLHYNVDAVIS